MKSIIPIVIGVAIWFLIVDVVWDMSHNGALSVLIGTLFGILATIVSDKMGGNSLKGIIVAVVDRLSKNMKLIISIVIGVAVWFLLMETVWNMSHNGELSFLIATLFGIFTIIISDEKLGGGSVKGIIVIGISYIKAKSEDLSSLFEDKDAELYAIVEQEIEDKVINSGLWSQALIKAKGDENLRKVEYMKLRAKQLKNKIEK